MSDTRLLQYFFLIAAVVSILDGVFPLQPTMESVKYIVLILSGIIVGSLIQKEQSKLFISGLSYSFGVFLIWGFLRELTFLNEIFSMLINFTIFISTVLIMLGLEQFLSLISPKLNSKKKKNKLGKKYLKTINDPKFEKVWSIIILIAVGFTFVIILSELFFNIGRLAKLFYFLDIIITFIFIVDVVILYLRSKNFNEFIRENFFDIISAIPLVGILRGLKLVRAIKIIRVSKITKLTKLVKASKTTKILKVNKSTKFFSKKSDFNNVESTKAKKRKS